MLSPRCSVVSSTRILLMLLITSTLSTRVLMCHRNRLSIHVLLVCDRGKQIEYADAADPSPTGRAGKEYHQAICMRAVNQSIGRSIRHATDYSSILLVDERYSKQVPMYSDALQTQRTL